MKITQIICQVLRVRSVEKKTASSQDVVLVRVRADNGVEGVGEADASPEVVQSIVDAPFSHNIACGLREILLGENPLENERLWQKMYRRTQYFGRTSVTIAAMSAVDMALWDLKGKHFGEPIHRLLGGKLHDRIPAYASILFGKDGEETEKIARRWTKNGYRAIKFGWEPMGKSEALDIELVRGARAGAGNDTMLLIDAGCVLTTMMRAHATSPGWSRRRVGSFTNIEAQVLVGDDGGHADRPGQHFQARGAGEVGALGCQHGDVVPDPIERPLLGEHANLEPARVVLDGVEGNGARQRGQHQHPIDCTDRALHGDLYSDTSRAEARNGEIASVRVPGRGVGAHGPSELGRARPRVGSDLLVRWA